MEDIVLPPGASQDPADLAAMEMPDMGGFTLAFMIPFERCDVYDELLIKDNPIGASPNMTFTELRPGYFDQDIDPQWRCEVRVQPWMPFFSRRICSFTLCSCNKKSTAVKCCCSCSPLLLRLPASSLAADVGRLRAAGDLRGTILRAYNL